MESEAVGRDAAQHDQDKVGDHQDAKKESMLLSQHGWAFARCWSDCWSNIWGPWCRIPGIFQLRAELAQQVRGTRRQLLVDDDLHHGVIRQ